MIKKYISIPIFAFALFTFSCKEEKHIPNVDNVKIDLNVVRFDKELFSVDTMHMDESLAKLSNKYPAFYKLYFESVLPLATDSSKFQNVLKGFLNNQQIKKLHDTTELIMHDFATVEKEMQQAFRYIKHYDPKFQVPNVYTFISEYGMQRFIFEDGGKDGIGIGLDLFLGGSYPYKNFDPTNPNFSNYLTRTFNKENIVPKTVDLIIDGMVGNPEGNKMIDFMVHNGKKLYLKKLFLPTSNDSLIYDFTPEQTAWVKDNEQEIWSFLASQNLVFETIPMKIAKYINPAPNSPGMPELAPGGTANYIGLRIVEAYIKKFPQTSIQQLLEMKDAQKMMELANYKPKRK